MSPGFGQAAVPGCQTAERRILIITATWQPESACVKRFVTGQRASRRQAGLLNSGYITCPKPKQPEGKYTCCTTPDCYIFQCYCRSCLPVAARAVSRLTIRNLQLLK